MNVGVSLSVLYRKPHRWTKELQVGMEDRNYCEEVIGYILLLYPYPQGRGALKEVGGLCIKNAKID